MYWTFLKFFPAGVPSSLKPYSFRNESAREAFPVKNWNFLYSNIFVLKLFGSLRLFFVLFLFLFVCVFCFCFFLFVFGFLFVCVFLLFLFLFFFVIYFSPFFRATFHSNQHTSLLWNTTSISPKNARKNYKRNWKGKPLRFDLLRFDRGFFCFVCLCAILIVGIIWM